MKNSASLIQTPSGDSWLDHVPTNWIVKKLKYVSQITPSGVWGEDLVDETRGCRVITTANIDSRGIIFTDGMTVRSMSCQELELGSCIAGDIVVVKSSGSATNVISGKAGLVKTEHLPICFSNFTLRVRPKPNVLNSRFAWHFLNSEIVRVQILLMVATTTYPNLQVDEYVSFRVPVPGYEEQLAIANYLDCETERLDRLVAAKERLLRRIFEKRRALIAHAVIRGLNRNAPLRESGVPWLGQIPAHWQTQRAKWLFKERDERSIDGEETLLSLRMERGLVPHNEVSEKATRNEDLIGYKRTSPDEIVLNRMRAASGLVAVSPQDGLVSPDYAVFRASPNADPHFFTHLFKTDLMQSVFRSESTGLGTGSSGFLRLYSESFLSFWLPIPPLSEQRDIVAFIASETARLDALRDSTKRTVNLLKERRAALIAASVTGKIRWPDSNANQGTLPQELPGVCRESCL